MIDLIVTSQHIQVPSKMSDFSKSTRSAAELIATTIFDDEKILSPSVIVRRGSTMSHDGDKNEEESMQNFGGKEECGSSFSDESSSCGSLRKGGKCDNFTTSPPKSSIIKCGDKPTKYDVVCGRDKFSHAHVGNKRFRVLIETNRERYQTAPSRDAKTRITTEVVTMIRGCGRFLKMEAGTNRWYDVGDEYAREKVSHALRSAKDPARKKVRRKRRPSQKKKLERSANENQVFQNLLAEQQRIFKQLIEVRAKT